MPTLYRSFFAAATALLALGLFAIAPPTTSAQGNRPGAGADHAVFVQTNGLAGNEILAFRRANDGGLTLDARYGTGGRGGRLEGAMSDPLASQGSLIYDPGHAMLIGVNAGSNSVY